MWVIKEQTTQENKFCFGVLDNACISPTLELNVEKIKRCSLNQMFLVRIMNDIRVSVDGIIKEHVNDCWVNCLKEITLDHFYVRQHFKSDIVRKSTTLIPTNGTNWLPGYIESDGVEQRYKVKPKIKISKNVIDPQVLKNGPTSQQGNETSKDKNESGIERTNVFFLFTNKNHTKLFTGCIYVFQVKRRRKKRIGNRNKGQKPLKLLKKMNQVNQTEQVEV